MQQHTLTTNHSWGCGVSPHFQKWPQLLNWLMAGFCLTIIVIRFAAPIGANDLWWHMVYGKLILATGQPIVDHSIFTWTEANVYFVYNAWLSEIILYLIYQNSGAVGLILLPLLVLGSFFALATYFASLRGVVSNPLTWLILLLGSMLSASGTLIIPELFSLLFMTMTVGLYFIIRALGDKAKFLCYLFPIILLDVQVFCITI